MSLAPFTFNMKTHEAIASLLISPYFDASNKALISQLSTLIDLNFKTMVSCNRIEKLQPESNANSSVAEFQGTLKRCTALFLKHHSKRLKIIHNGIVYSLTCLSYTTSSSELKGFQSNIDSKMTQVSRIRSSLIQPGRRDILNVIDELGDDVLGVTTVFKEFKSPGTDDMISLWGACSAIRIIIGMDFPVEYLISDLSDLQAGHQAFPTLSHISSSDLHLQTSHVPKFYKPPTAKQKLGVNKDTKLDAPQMQITYLEFLSLFLKVKNMSSVSDADLGLNSSSSLKLHDIQGGRLGCEGSSFITSSNVGGGGGDSECGSSSSASLSNTRDIMRRARVRRLETDRTDNSYPGSEAVSECKLHCDKFSFACSTGDASNVVNSDSVIYEPSIRDQRGSPPNTANGRPSSPVLKSHRLVGTTLARTTKSECTADEVTFCFPCPFPTSYQLLDLTSWLAIAPFWEVVESALHRCCIQSYDEVNNCSVSLELKAIFMKYDINR